MDPIADMLTRIRNATAAGKAAVAVPYSGMKLRIAELLKRHGYLASVSQQTIEGQAGAILQLELVYHGTQPAFQTLRRISTPGLRIYRGVAELPSPRGGFGMIVISTPKGLMTEREARRAGLGGEVICEVIS